MSVTELSSDNARARRGTAWRRRLGVEVALSAMLMALVVVVAPGAAHAAAPCGNPPNLGNAHFVSGDWVGTSWRSVLTVFYFLEPPALTFNEVESKVIDNQLPTPSQGTFTSSLSQTFTITTSQTNTVSVQNQLGVTFQNSVSQQIQQSVQTTVGFSTTVIVQPFSRVRGRFGVEAFILHYNMARWEIGGGRCWWRPEMGRADVFANAPTTTQVWRTELA